MFFFFFCWISQPRYMPVQWGYLACTRMTPTIDYIPMKCILFKFLILFIFFGGGCVKVVEYPGWHWLLFCSYCRLVLRGTHLRLFQGHSSYSGDACVRNLGMIAPYQFSFVYFQDRFIHSSVWGLSFTFQETSLWNWKNDQIFHPLGLSVDNWDP